MAEPIPGQNGIIKELISAFTDARLSLQTHVQRYPEDFNEPEVIEAYQAIVETKELDDYPLLIEQLSAQLSVAMMAIGRISTENDWVHAKTMKKGILLGKVIGLLGVAQYFAQRVNWKAALAAKKTSKPN